MSTLELLELAGYASRIKSLIPNHIQHGIPQRIAARIEEEKDFITLCKRYGIREHIPECQRTIKLLKDALRIYLT